MRKLLLTIIICLLAIAHGHAVKANSVPFEVTQPDGTTLTVVLHGDENFRWHTTTDGIVIMPTLSGFRIADISADGDIYVLLAPQECAPDYITFDNELSLNNDSSLSLTSATASLYFQAGKKEKISRGDIVGFIANNGGITAQEIGKISLHDHYAIVALPRCAVDEVLQRITRLKIKNKRVKITRIG